MVSTNGRRRVRGSARTACPMRDSAGSAFRRHSRSARPRNTATVAKCQPCTASSPPIQQSGVSARGKSRLELPPRLTGRLRVVERVVCDHRLPALAQARTSSASRPRAIPRSAGRATCTRNGQLQLARRTRSARRPRRRAGRNPHRSAPRQRLRPCRPATRIRTASYQHARRGHRADLPVSTRHPVRAAIVTRRQPECVLAKIGQAHDHAAMLHAVVAVEQARLRRGRPPAAGRRRERHHALAASRGAAASHRR